MKAFLLAAGKGTRLQPLTFGIPKCLVPVCGRPLIEYWFDLFEIYGIDDILINTSHLAGQVREYVRNNARGLKIKVTYEKKLLGSGGTIKENWDFVEEEEDFYVFYADNLTNIRLDRMFQFHKSAGKDLTIAVFRVSNPKECGIVGLDEHSTVVSFQEKPANPVSDLAFAGIMLGTQKLKDFFPDKDMFDIGYDVLPCAVNQASGHFVEEYLLDIGTDEKLRKAEEDIKNNVLSMGMHGS